MGRRIDERRRRFILLHDAKLVIISCCCCCCCFPLYIAAHPPLTHPPGITHPHQHRVGVIVVVVLVLLLLLLRLFTPSPHPPSSPSHSHPPLRTAGHLTHVVLVSVRARMCLVSFALVSRLSSLLLSRLSFSLWTTSHPLVDLLEERHRVLERLDEHVHLRRRVVDVQRRARRRPDLQIPVQRLRAVMPASRGNPGRV